MVLNDTKDIIMKLNVSGFLITLILIDYYFLLQLGGYQHIH